MQKAIDWLGKKKEWMIGICIFFICFNYMLMNYQQKGVFVYESDTPIVNGNACPLYPSEEITQYFVCPENRINGVAFPIHKITDAEGFVVVELFKNDQLLYEKQLEVRHINSDQYYTHLLENSVDNQETDVYWLKVRNESSAMLSIELTASFEGDTSLQKENADFSGQRLCTKIIYENYNMLWLIIVLSIATVIGIVIAVFCAKKEMKLEQVFLALGGYIGILYFLTLPAFRAPDEINHYMRAFEISRGAFVSQHMGETGVGGNYLPENTIAAELCDARKIDYYKVWENRNQTMNDTNLVPYTFGNTALYAPLVYLPQVIGISIGRIFTDSSVYLVYIGRFVTFLFCYLLLFLSIKNTLIRKNAMFLTCFMPMLLSQIVSLSADAVTIVTAFTLITLCIKINMDNNIDVISNKQRMVIFMLTLLLSLCKIVYLPLCFIILWLDKNKFKSKKDALIFKAGTLAFISIVNIVWLSISSGFLVEFNPGVNSKEQVKYVLTHIIDYMGVCMNTFLLHAQGWLEQMVGSKLGWAMDVEVPLILISSILVLLVIFIINAEEGDEKELNIMGKGTMLMVFLVTVALIFTSLYVQWTPLANNLVNGIQGRYFIPLIPIVVTLCATNKRKCKYDYGILYLFMFGVNMMAVMKQIFFYL